MWGRGKKSESKAVAGELEVDGAKCLSEDRGRDREEEVVGRGELMI